jgi:hypothetical protein
MCDFHSTVWRCDGAMAHLASNSHSGAVEAAGWRENQPNRERFFWEAEWDGEGDFPSDNALVRGADTCPEPVMKKIKAHYRLLQKTLSKAQLFPIFLRPGFSDVRYRVAGNVSTPATVLETLAKDSDSDVRRRVAERLKK